MICPGPTPTPLLDDMKAEDAFAEKVLSGMDKIILSAWARRTILPRQWSFLPLKRQTSSPGGVLSVSGGLTMAD
ncbi:MAG: hypothetical protein R2860_12240 [Desulfobacterales bacterium]